MQQTVDYGELITLSAVAEKFAGLLRVDAARILRFLREVVHARCAIMPAARAGNGQNTAPLLFGDVEVAQLYLMVVFYLSWGYSSTEAIEAVRLTANYDRDPKPGVKRPADALVHAIGEIRAGRPVYFVLKHVNRDLTEHFGRFAGYLSPVADNGIPSLGTVEAVVTLPIHVLLAPLFGIDAETAARFGLNHAAAA